MGHSYDHLTVAIAVACEDGAYSVGTGVPIAKGLVLTARHVVCPDDACPAPVQVRFWHATEPDFRPGGNNETHGVKDALGIPDGDGDARRGVVWTSDRLDVALVRVEHPDSVGVALLGRDLHRDLSDWVSDAFPDSAWENGAPRSVRLRGKCFSRDRNEPRFQIEPSIAMTYDDGRREDRQEGWAGASGAGIFIGGQLFGTMLTRRPNQQGRVLEAVPIADCLADPSFSAFLQGDEDTAFYETKMREYLRALSPGLRGAICQILGLDAGSDDAAMLGALCACDLEMTTDALFDLRAGAAADDDQKICSLALHLAALRYAPAGTTKLRHAVYETQADFDGCAAGFHMMAELIMASADARLPEFRAQADAPGALPEGRYVLPPLPEAGIDGSALDDSDIEGRMGADLIGLAVDVARTDARLNERLGRVYAKDADTPEKIQRRHRFVIAEMQHRKRRRQNLPTFYYVCEDPGPDRAEERAALGNRIETIKSAYPRIGTVFLKPELEDDEYDRLRPFSDFLTP